MARIYANNVVRTVMTSAKPRILTITRNKVDRAFAVAKKELLEEFDSDPATIAIQRGPLGGDAGRLNGKGSLWGFLGFWAGSNPVAPVRELLSRQTRISRGRVNARVNEPSITFKTRTPSREDIAKVSRLPWSNQSWVFGLEEGVSGLERFIYWKNRGSRSKAGIQADKPVRSASMNPQPYLSKFLSNFRNKLRNLIQ